MSWIPIYPFDQKQTNGISVNGMVTKHKPCLHVLYRITGHVERIIFPENMAVPPTRRNGLWETTCFELFLKDPHSTQYLEFNFAPNGDWNAYSFTDYRKDMCQFDGIVSIKISSKHSTHTYQLEAIIHPKNGHSLFWDDANAPSIKAGLSAVIETASHHKSYWSLQHPASKPDFHLASSFTLNI